ncbi:MAG TPA: TonB-dependent receptor [Sphingomicrobium sp.]|nr:TonB-dependent receptor [Sphingomicrobium sp.]
MLVPILLAAAQDIVITASLVPEDSASTPASAVVLDHEAIDRLGEPLAPALLRLTPSASVESSGPAGSLAQVRIRGAEANHTLLFIDGIRANDPAAGDIPRFELLNADIVSRIEVVRGPQSALWGSDAIGGVVAINGVASPKSAHSAALEGGSFGFGRLGGSAAIVSDKAEVAAAVGYQRALGIDAFSEFGEREGYRNLAIRARGSWAFAPGFELGASGFSLAGRSEFDGFDPATFRRADTLDNSRNRMSAGRLWLSGGDAQRGLSGTVSASLLGSSNRNFLGRDEINRTSGGRRLLGGQLEYRLATGRVRHTAIVALEHEREEFHARDTLYFGASNQDRSRSRQAVTAEWRTELSPMILDIAVRKDVFSAFRDSTSVRASALALLGAGFSLAGSYSEGIAQPTFFDLFGFFPGSFVGNPRLRPERSRGFEASLRFRHGRFEAALTGYRQRLKAEIVDVFDPATFLSSAVNRAESSRRSGLEVEISWSVGEALRLGANYSHLRASEPGISPNTELREVRRPRHSGALFVDGKLGRFVYGTSFAYTGARFDNDFDAFPARRVRLDPYWLAGARIAYEVRPGLELFARASNLFGANYQDVFGYRTEGRGLFAGISLGGR